MAIRKSVGRQVRRRQLLLPPIDAFIRAIEDEDTEQVAVFRRHIRAGLPQAMRDAASRELRATIAARRRGERAETREDIVRVIVY